MEVSESGNGEWAGSSRRGASANVAGAGPVPGAYKEMHRQRLQGDSQTFSIVLRCYAQRVASPTTVLLSRLEVTRLSPPHHPRPFLHVVTGVGVGEVHGRMCWSSFFKPLCQAAICFARTLNPKRLLSSLFLVLRLLAASQTLPPQEPSSSVTLPTAASAWGGGLGPPARCLPTRWLDGRRRWTCSPTSGSPSPCTTTPSSPSWPPPARLTPRGGHGSLWASWGG